MPVKCSKCGTELLSPKYINNKPFCFRCYLEERIRMKRENLINEAFRSTQTNLTMFLSD